MARALTQDGEGDTVGSQLVTRLRPWRGLSGFVTYTLSRSRRRDAPGRPRRPFDHDQTHAVTAVASVELGAWRLGARARLVSGEPRTPVVGAVADASSGRFQPLFGRTNGARLPAFAALDVRLERRLSLGGIAATGFAEVENATMHANHEEIVYSADFAERGFLDGPPMLALAGLAVELP
jgi:hypothetical protein